MMADVASVAIKTTDRRRKAKAGAKPEGG